MLRPEHASRESVSAADKPQPGSKVAVRATPLVLIAFLIVGVLWKQTHDRQKPSPAFTLTVLPRSWGEFAEHINNRGEVVVAGNEQSLFVWKNGKRDYSLKPCGINCLGDPLLGDINDNAMVAGRYFEGASDKTHACLWLSSGECKSLGALGGSLSESTGVNNKGQVVGWAETTTTAPQVIDGKRFPVCHAFLWERGHMMDIDPGGPGSSFAEAIHNDGTIVLSKQDASDHVRQYLWNHGEFKPISGLDGYDVKRINDRDQILAIDPEGASVLWKAGKRTRLSGFFGRCYGFDLNNRGQVVGTMQTLRRLNDFGMSIPTAFLYSDGMLYDVNDLTGNPDVIVETASGINDRTQIVGTGRLKRQGELVGEQVAVLLTPK